MRPTIPQRVRRTSDAGSSFKTILFVGKNQNKADSGNRCGRKAFQFRLFRPGNRLLSLNERLVGEQRRFGPP
ncbi:MAG: hypothetical protein J0M17_18130 [Planctomycetes bacterium]|nr:hypothetical protein [Planctomycetota bacterium]